MSKIAFIIGNGTSRSSVQLTTLSQYGTTYGCNALYRDFAPDHLVSVDPNMIKEIYDSGYCEQHNVWIRCPKGMPYIKNVFYLESDLKWCSGTSAMILAASHGHDKMYMLGFDYTGLENNTRFNNVYADTKNYKKSIQRHTYYHNWLNQTKTVIKNNPHIDFVRVVLKDSAKFVEFDVFDNFSLIDIGKFKEIYQKP